MSSVLMFRELTREDPSCDIMCSYDGSVLTTHLKQGPPDVPEGVTLFDYVSEQVYDKHGIIMLDPLGINNTYCIAVRSRLPGRNTTSKPSAIWYRCRGSSPSVRSMSSLRRKALPAP